ncbi:MAG: MarR family transcriptional regulator [Chloroflexi bacterium]|nr:MarR family transcriptional regulator [Chloroflexota bacterium]
MMPDASQLQGEMVALIRAFGLLRPDETPCGQPVGVSTAHALVELAQGEPLAQTELGRQLRLKKSTVSRLVGQLVHRGWVRQVRDTNDGRAVRLRLTEGGWLLARQIAAARAEKFAQLAERVPAEQFDAVVQALRVLVRALDDRPSTADRDPERVLSSGASERGASGSQRRSGPS